MLTLPLLASLGGCAALVSPLAETCSWPSVHGGGLFGNSTVQLAQRLLGHALAEPNAVADGVFSAATTASIVRFQEAEGLCTSGAHQPAHCSSGVTKGFLNAGVSGHTPLAAAQQAIPPPAEAQAGRVFV